MKLILVSPTKNGETFLFNRGLLAPLGLMYIAANTPAGIDVRIVDENVERIDFSDVPDVVGITTLTQTAPRAYAIADRYRAAGAKVILGGIHASMLPDEALRHADSVVAGEAEEIWPRVISDAVSGTLEPFYHQEGFAEFKRPRQPRRDLVDGRRYWSPNSIQTSRGCPHNCSFCSVTAFNGRKVRMRAVDDVLAEVESLPRSNLIRKKVVPFVDDNIAANPRRAKELFRGLSPMKVIWGSQASISFAEDEELVALAAESGCRFLFIGLETLSPATLSEMGKSQNRVERYAYALRLLREYRIHVMGAFVFGFDTDDESAFDSTLEFAIENRIQVAQFANLTPYPGTRLYDRLLAENRLEPGFWMDPEWDSRVVFQPSGMSPGRLYDNTRRLHLDFYSYRNIIRRMSFYRHWSYWFAFNLLYRQSVVSARTHALEAQEQVPATP